MPTTRSHHAQLSSRHVLMGRHYHAAGWKVAELARLFGVSRDALSKAINFRTHANLQPPDGWVVPQLPSRPPPEPPKPGRAFDPFPRPLTVSPEAQRIANRLNHRYDPPPVSREEQLRRHREAHPVDEREQAKLREEQREAEAQSREWREERERRAATDSRSSRFFPERLP